MQEVNIKAAIRHAIESSGRQYKEVASSAEITPQNLSNLLNEKSNREVPLAVLRRLVIELDDLDLKWTASDWTYQIGLAQVGTTVIPIPIAVKEDVDDEQDDREQLDKAARRIFKRQPATWSAEEVRFINRYRKELNEEVSAEHRFLDSIDDALKQAPKGGL